MNTTDLKTKAKSLKGAEPDKPYFFINSVMGVEVSEWKGTKVDQARELAGNIFYSRQAAEKFAIKVVKFLVEHNVPEKPRE